MIKVKDSVLSQSESTRSCDAVEAMEAIKDSKEPLDFWSWWNDLMSCGCGGRAGDTKFNPRSVSTSKMELNTLQPNRGSVGLILQKRNNEYANLNVSSCHSKINLFPSHGGMRVVAIAADGFRVFLFVA